METRGPSSPKSFVMMGSLVQGISLNLPESFKPIAERPCMLPIITEMLDY